MTPAKQATPDELREQAAQLRAQAAAAEAEVRRQEQAERDRKAAAQAEWDRAFVKGFDRKPHDAEVERARHELERVLEDNPIVKALAALHAAEQRVRWLVGERVQAEGRLGRDVSSISPQPPPLILAVGDHVHRTAERMSSDAVRQEREQLERSREEAT